VEWYRRTNHVEIVSPTKYLMRMIATRDHIRIGLVASRWPSAEGAARISIPPELESGLIRTAPVPVGCDPPVHVVGCPVAVHQSR